MAKVPLKPSNFVGAFGADSTRSPHALLVNPDGSLATAPFVTVASDSFTRPSDTTAYASGDLVSNSVTAGSVTPLAFTIGRNNGVGLQIRRARIKISGTVVTNAQFRLHLYKASPTVANGDNGAWSSTESSYLGYIAITVDQVFSDGAVGLGSPAAGVEINTVPTAKVLYGLLEARAAFTPISAEVFTVTLESVG